MIFVLIRIKQALIWFNLQIDGTGNGLSNIKDTFAESLQLQMSILHQSMCIFKAGLSSLSDYWVKYRKKKYMMCEILNKLLKEHLIPNSSLQNLKIYSSKGCIETSQIWIIYVANTAYLKLKIFGGRYFFRLWVFDSTCEHFFFWHWKALPKVLQGKWCQEL